jgi:ATP-dependent Clp protease ATP-binding subunit ClpC
MPDKMERFTQRARRVMELAQKEAERVGQGVIGTEYLLLGMMREEGGVAGRALREVGLDARRVELLVGQMNTRKVGRSGGKLHLSAGTRRVLRLAVDEAHQRKHRTIGTGHLLIGLLRLNEGGAIDIFKRVGIAPDEVRKEIDRISEQDPLQSAQPSPPLPSSLQKALTEANKRLRIRFVDKTSGKVTSEFEASFPEVRAAIRVLMEALASGRMAQADGKLLEVDDDELSQRIEILLELQDAPDPKDEPKTDS